MIELKAKNNGIISTYSGQKIHGLFFKLLKEANKELADTIHNNTLSKAFTISTFLNEKIGTPIEFRKGKKYYFRVTFLSDEVYEIFLTKLYKNRLLRKSIKVGDIYFLINRIFFNESENEWANTFNIENIIAKDNFKSVIKLKFITPTLFKIGDKYLKEPDVEKIFNGLLKKFNLYNEIKIDDSIKNKFLDIKIKNKNIKPKKVYLTKFFIEGFIGEVEFEIPKEIVKIVNILLEFSFYSGIGYKTTMGFGQVKILKEG
ncbi:hypothetical protein OSSY52_18800 [Tepiditoga spiralis]|uniref:Uncharacterized protein n=1 Tax=Tepiditoga spiralis TaxID=2108365 RepID=A0A7G1GC46_9BACT|nr:hypothetical protein OSSY52_18800 [Tepiditoga spiralis]